jgi:hypothetical protein
MKVFEWLIRTTIWLLAETSLWHVSWTDGEYFISNGRLAAACDLFQNTNDPNLYVLYKY